MALVLELAEADVGRAEVRLAVDVGRAEVRLAVDVDAGSGGYRTRDAEGRRATGAATCARDARC
jgi:hypothetical protein